MFSEVIYEKRRNGSERSPKDHKKHERMSEKKLEYTAQERHSDGATSVYLQRL